VWQESCGLKETLNSTGLDQHSELLCPQNTNIFPLPSWGREKIAKEVVITFLGLVFYQAQYYHSYLNV